MIRIILNRAGEVLAVQDDAKRGVVRAGVSLRRFVEAVNEEFPELKVNILL